MAGQTLRELLVKFGFQADTAALDKIEAAIRVTKEVATETTQVVAEMAAEVGQMAAEAARGATGLDEVAAAAKVMGEALVAAGEAGAGAAASLTEGFTAVGGEVAAVETRARGLGTVLAGLASQARDLATGAAAMMGGFGAGAGGVGGKGRHGHGEEAGLLGLVGMGKTMLLGVGATMGVIGAEQAGEHFAEFQQNLQKAGAAGLMNPEQIAAMKKQVLAVSGDTGFNARQVSEGAIEIAGKGFHAHDVVQMLPTAMKLARAGMVDAKTATELLTTAVEGFYGRDKGAGKAKEIADLLATTHDVGGIQMPALLEGMKYMGPAAGAMGQSMKDMMELTALLGRFGIHGSLSGNALKSMMVKLAAPTELGASRLAQTGLIEETTGAHGKHNKKVHESVIKALGITTKDAHGNILPMIEILKQIAGKWDSMGTAKQAAVAKGLVGLEDVPQFMALMKSMAHGGEGFKEVVERFNNANGALDRMNQIMQQGLKPAWERMMAKAEVFADLVLERLAPGLVWLFDTIASGLDHLNAFIQWLEAVTAPGGRFHWMLVAARMAMAAMLPFLAALALVELPALAEGFLLAAAAAVRAAVSFLLAEWPLALILAALALVVLAIQDFYTYLHGGDSFFGRFAAAAKSAWDSFMKSAHAAMDAVIKKVDETIAKVVNLAHQIGGVLAMIPGLGAVGQALQNLGQTVVSTGIKDPRVLHQPALAGVRPSSGVPSRYSNEALGVGGPTQVSHTWHVQAPVTVQHAPGNTPAQDGHQMAGAFTHAIRHELARAADQVPVQVR